ncbi:MAG: hypothetical protein AWU57_452 [Marinobacter sp. T13-3]|nr:MAG: hypothetical protein AWU57_452 [Marinobacter sp. T13-3]
MTGRSSVAIIVAAAILALAAIAYQYMAPYNSCVRGLVEAGAPERVALMQCRGV